MRTDATSSAPPAPAPLAIVGLGCLFPKAGGPGAFWANVKAGTDCLTDVPATHWDPADYFDPDPKAPDMTYARRGGFLSAVAFNPLEFGIPPKDIEATDTTQLLGLVAAKMALTDAGVTFADAPGAPGVARDRVSVILGVTGTLELVVPLGARLGHPKWKRAMADAGIPADAAADACARIAESYVPWQENSFPGLLGNVVAGRIANKLDLHGTNCVVDAACASSLSAVHLAAMELQTGRADVAVTGGTDTFNDIFMFMCFSKTPALSPTGSAKPFDAAGDGTILGEGLGVLVLKRLADAERDGDTVYAVLKGVGTSSDGKGNAIYAPSSSGQERCLRNAYANANVSPDTIELVEAHGTGTKVGDAAEASALTSVYSAAARGDQPRPWCAIGSVKSQIGHTKAAAGAASLIKVALSLHNKVLPPTIKVTLPVEPLRATDSPFYVNTTMRPWLPRAGHPRRAGVSAFGFGGSNFHCVLEEYAPEKAAPDWDGAVEILAISGDTAAAVAAKLAAVPAEWDAFARAAEASREAFRASHRFRLTLAAHRTHTDLAKLLAGAAGMLARSPAANWHTPDGAHFGVNRDPGKLAVLFPGQGSQSVGMLRDVACLFPEALATLAAADAAFAAGKPTSAPRLSDIVYPPTSFAPDAAAKHDAALRETAAAQPALGAVSLAAWDVLRTRFDVAADAAAGHSYGELVALTAAGRLTPAELHDLSNARGRLMAAAAAGADAGGMLAVTAAADVIEAAVRDHLPGITLANRNAPNQTVLSGPTAAIDTAEKYFAGNGVRATRLAVAAAFHSPLVADAARPFRDALAAVEFPVGRLPVFANTTAGVYPAAADAARDVLGGQLANAVLFAEQIRGMAGMGVTTFLEVGPGATLVRLAEATLSAAGGDYEFAAVAGSGGRRPGMLDFADALARLAARGHAVRLAGWEAGSRCRPPAPAAKSGLTVAVCGANAVLPRPPRVPQAPAETTDMADTAPGRDPSDLARALQATQQTLAALQQMQEQTAGLHRQFLNSQDAAQRTLAALVAQQAALFSGGVMPALPPVVPVPVVVVPPPAVVPAVVVPPPVKPPMVPPVAYAPGSPPAPPRPVAVVVPPPAVVVPIPKPVPTPLPAPAGLVAATLLAVVSEKTGYPAEMLGLDMALDADLGIDSIKRVEILSAVQEKLPHAPVVKPEHLGTLHTLKDVADFLNGGDAGTVEVVVPMATPVDEFDAVPDPAAVLPLPAGVMDIPATLLAVVSEKTGYPAEMLGLDMALDADLGIDSIKRVEILSAVQEKLPHAPVVKPEHLGTLHTLKDVADFLSGVPSAAGPTTKKEKVPTLAEVLSPGTPVGSADAAAMSILTAPEPVPAPFRPRPPEPARVPEPFRSFEPAPPPRTEKIPAVLLPQIPDSLSAAAMPKFPASPPRTGPPADPRPGDAARIPPPSDAVERSILQAVDLDLSTMRPRVPLAEGGEIWVVGDAADPAALALADQLAKLGFRPQAFAWADVAAARPAAALTAVVLVAPARPAPGMPLNRLAFQWVQTAGPRLRQTAKTSAAAVMTVARLDGAFGLSNLQPSADPASGGLAGIVKTARYEWPDLAFKAVDLAPSFADTPAAAAAALVEELLSSGPVEVGIAPTHRCTLELARTVRRPATQTVAFGPKDVILVTGGGRGVTAEAAVALADAYRPTLILTGRTPAPAGPEPAWSAGITDEAALKKNILANTPDPTPKAVNEAYSRVLAQRDIRDTLARVGATGAKAAYFPVNVASGRAVADLLHQVQVRYGPITGLVHGAGVLADRKIEQLTTDQFDYVYSTKVDGVRNLLDLLGGQELKAVVLFSSTTARFGRTGQLAYAAANEVLNKTAQAEARRRPTARVVAINWGPWEGGMVTPALRKMFESEGIGLVPLADGGAFVVHELNAAGRAVEVVALGAKARSGTLTNPPGRTHTPAPLPVPAAAPTTNPPPPDLALAFERVIDVATHPILRSHVLDGRAVLPMAIHLEWLAHAALHGNPGLVFHGFNDLRITHGVMVEDGSTTTLRLMAGKAVKQDKLFAVPVEIRGRRKDGRDVIHSRAEIVLAAALPKPPAADRPPDVQAYPHPLSEVYQYFLFHGPDLHGIEAVDGLTDVAFIGSAYPSPTPGEWFTTPFRSAWVADPLVLDASFQMMILWSFAQHGAGSLPCFAGRYRQYRRAFPAGAVKVVIRVTRDNGSFARADVDYIDADGVIVAQMQDYECVIDVGLNQAFRRNQLAPLVGK